MPNSPEKGNYVPCRVFKNASYGALAISNNRTAYELLEGRVVYEADIPALLQRAEEISRERDYQRRITDLMRLIRDRHTYLNRIDTLLKCLQECRGIHNERWSPMVPSAATGAAYYIYAMIFSVLKNAYVHLNRRIHVTSD
jgi:spore maturation protein CgeB